MLEAPLLSLGAAGADSLLCGGIHTGQLTEVAGEAGCGKTQLCLHLLLRAQLPRPLGGLGGAAVYLCTEGDFAVKRLKQMVECDEFALAAGSHPHVALASTRASRRGAPSRREGGPTTTAAVGHTQCTATLDRVFVKVVRGADELDAAIVSCVFSGRPAWARGSVRARMGCCRPRRPSTCGTCSVCRAAAVALWGHS